MDRITLPKPVSVNAMYRTTVRNGHSETYMSQRGKDWLNECQTRLQYEHNYRERTKMLSNDVIVYVWLYTCRNGDIDNIGKCTMDLLQKSGVIENDNQVVELHMYKERVKHVKDEKMELQVEAWE